MDKLTFRGAKELLQRGWLQSPPHGFRQQHDLCRDHFILLSYPTCPPLRLRFPCREFRRVHKAGTYSAQALESKAPRYTPEPERRAQLDMGRSFRCRNVIWMPHGVRRSCHAAPPRDSGLARWQENQNNLLQVQGHDNYATRKKPTQPSSHF